MHDDDEMTERELAEYIAARFRALIRMGLRDGAASSHRTIERLPEDEVRLLLTTAIGFEIARVRQLVTATHNN